MPQSKPRAEAQVKPRPNSNCAVVDCKRKAAMTIASARREDYSYVPVCNKHHDSYLEADGDVIRAVESF